MEKTGRVRKGGRMARPFSREEVTPPCQRGWTARAGRSRHRKKTSGARVTTARPNARPTSGVPVAVSGEMLSKAKLTALDSVPPIAGRLEGRVRPARKMRIVKRVPVAQKSCVRFILSLVRSRAPAGIRNPREYYLTKRKKYRRVAAHRNSRCANNVSDPVRDRTLGYCFGSGYFSRNVLKDSLRKSGPRSSSL